MRCHHKIAKNALNFDNLKVTLQGNMETRQISQFIIIIIIAIIITIIIIIIIIIVAKLGSNTNSVFNFQSMISPVELNSLFS